MVGKGHKLSYKGMIFINQMLFIRPSYPPYA